MSGEPTARRLAPLAFAQYGAEAAIFFSVIGFFHLFPIDAASAIGGWLGRNLFYRTHITTRARASLAPNGLVTGWIDLSAQDQAAVLDDPVPGHLAENGLRNAWFDWDSTHSGNGDPTAGDSDLMQHYLLNIVLSRLRGQVGGTISSVQIRTITTLIPGPTRTAAQTAPQTRTLDWWPV